MLQHGRGGMARYFSIVLVLVLLLALSLSACGGDDDGEQATEPPANSPTESSSIGATPTGATTPDTASPEATADSAMATATNEPTAGATSEATREATSEGGTDAVTLRIGVSMTPPELETFQAGIDAIEAAHPNWTIEVEQTPQEGIIEKMNAQIAGGDLPDVVQVQGLMAHQWIRQDVFEDLTTFTGDDAFNVDDFWAGALDQFRWNDGLYGIPNTVAPDMLYYNKAMFDAAGVEYPSDEWTFENLRLTALQLTLDANGNNAEDPEFDPDNVVQWGFNATPSNIWARHFLLPFGADPCANDDCTELNYSSPESIEALQWWADLAQSGAAPYDPYSGNQTGVPGDPFSAGLAAMGYNGYFAIGQLNATGTMEYDIVQPPMGEDGIRATPLSTNGWSIPSSSEQKDAAWELIAELTSPEFLTEYWAQPGHAVPSRRSASDSILDPESAPDNRQAILDALEYAEVFRPFTASAFEAFAKTAETFAAMMKGDIDVAEGAAQIDNAANEVLGKDVE